MGIVEVVEAALNTPDVLEILEVVGKEEDAGEVMWQYPTGLRISLLMP